MSVVKVTDENFSNQLAEQENVIVKYFADWCGTCRLFAPKFNRLAEDDRFGNITFLDVNAEQNPVARKLAGVDNLPFFATFKNGVLVDATTSAKEETVVEMLEKLKQ